MLKIAIINPPNKDGLAKTIFDGFVSLALEKYPVSFKYVNKVPYFEEELKENLCEDRNKFEDYAKESDIIFLVWGKNCTDYDLAKKINSWDKTIFIDGSEFRGDGRYDFDVQKNILNGKYTGLGKIDREMLKKCKAYFRREKPYIDGIIPLPFGIESTYTKNYSINIEKDIDFFCVFGQDEYPLMRKYSIEVLEKFCKKNNFSYFTGGLVHRFKRVDGNTYFKKLARSKVGISIGGGGFDTFRFWEVLGNNCLLLTENIDIYQPNSKRLDYERVWQFGNLFDFEYQLEKIGHFLKNEYKQENLTEEYNKIIPDHSSKSRVLEIINKCREVGII